MTNKSRDRCVVAGLQQYRRLSVKMRLVQEKGYILFFFKSVQKLFYDKILRRNFDILALACNAIFFTPVGDQGLSKEPLRKASFLPNLKKKSFLHNVYVDVSQSYLRK